MPERALKEDVLISRFERAKAIKMLWRDLLSDAYEYALPNRNLYFSGDETDPGQIQGQKKVDRVFDSTAPNSTINFANRIQSDMMPAFQRWMKLEAGPAVPEQMRAQVNKQLELITEQFFAVIQASNFDMSNNEALLDLAIGTAVMLVLEGTLDKPVQYIAMPAPQIYLEEGPWGSVIGVYRLHHLELRNIPLQWPDIKITSLPDTLQQDMKDAKKAEKKVQLLESCYMETDPGTKAEKWCYDIVLMKEKKRILERNYEENPWIVARWIKVPGEVYGRGPVIQALPDIKTINKLRELVLKNAALHISGVYTGVDDGILNPNTVTIRPGVVIPVASNGGTRGPSLQRLEATGKFDLANIEYEKLHLAIKQVLLDNRLPPESGAVRSATEIIERIKELARDIGSPFARLLQEYIVPIVQRTLNIMRRRGLIPAVKVNGLNVQVRVVSPLAQEQNLNDVGTVVRWLTILQSFGPEVLHLAAKTEDVGDWMGDKLGVPAKLRRDKDEREGMQKMVAGMLAQQQAQAQGIPTQPTNPQTIGLAAGAAGVPLRLAA